MENKLPLVHLVESGGANLLYQAEIFVPGGRGFANQARMSARGIPQVTVVHGSSTAGGAYLPGLSDYVIMVRNQAKVFLAGPPLLKAATGEIATQIAAMQAATKESVGAIKEIGDTVARIAEIARTIAGAVEEQGAATQGIARNVQHAARGTAELTTNIADVNRGAADTGVASAQVFSSAQSLSRESGRLKLEVGKFLASVRNQ